MSAWLVAPGSAEPPVASGSHVVPPVCSCCSFSIDGNCENRTKEQRCFCQHRSSACWLDKPRPQKFWLKSEEPSVCLEDAAVVSCLLVSMVSADARFVGVGLRSFHEQHRNVAVRRGAETRARGSCGLSRRPDGPETLQPRCVGPPAAR